MIHVGNIIVHADAVNDDNVNVCLWHVTLDKYQIVDVGIISFRLEMCLLGGLYKKST